MFWHCRKETGGRLRLQEVVVTALLPAADPRAASSPGLQHHDVSSRKGKEKKSSSFEVYLVPSRCTWGCDLSQSSSSQQAAILHDGLLLTFASVCSFPTLPDEQPGAAARSVAKVRWLLSPAGACLVEHHGSSLEGTKMGDESANTCWLRLKSPSTHICRCVIP